MGNFIYRLKIRSEPKILSEEVNSELLPADILQSHKEKKRRYSDSQYSMKTSTKITNFARRRFSMDNIEDSGIAPSS